MAPNPGPFPLNHLREANQPPNQSLQRWASLLPAASSVLPALQVLSTASKFAVSRRISEKSTVGFVHQHAWVDSCVVKVGSTDGIRTSPFIHRRVDMRVSGLGGGVGVSWRVQCCTRHIVNSISHPIIPAAGKTKHKTYDCLMTAVLHQPEWVQAVGGGIHWDCPLGGYQPARGQTQGPSHKRLIVGV